MRSYFFFDYSYLLVLLSLIFLFFDLFFTFNKWFSIGVFCSLFIFLGHHISGERSFLSSFFIDNENSLEDVYIFRVEKVYDSSSKWRRVILSFNESNDYTNKVLLVAKNFNYSVGDMLEIDLEIKSIKNKGNPGEFNSQQYYISKSIEGIGFYDNTDNSIQFISRVSTFSFVQFISNKSKSFSKVFDDNLSEINSSLAKALVLGNKSSIDNEIKKGFSNTGAMHVLAVSGLHIGIILSILIYILQLFSKFISKTNAFFIAIIILWLYAVLTGLSPSIIRATFLFSILSFSKVFSKNNNSINSLCFTAFTLLLINPLYIYDIGFQLSYLAMFGIFLFYDVIRHFFYSSNNMLNLLWKGTALGISAQLFTFPLTIYYFHQFPNYFILTNLGLILLTGFILGLGVFSLVFHKIIYLNTILFSVFSYSLFILLKFISSIDTLPFSVAYGFSFTIIEVLLIYLFLILLLLVYKLKIIKFNIIITSTSLLMLIYIECGRFSNLNINEICFFNHNSPIFLIKEGDKSICFYDGKIQHAKRLINDYRKLKPCKVIYKNLKGMTYNVSSNNIALSIDNEDGYCLIKLNNEKYFINYDGTNKSKEYIEFKTIYFDNISKKHDLIKNNLTNGAIIFKIKKSDQNDRILNM